MSQPIANTGQPVNYLREENLRTEGTLKSLQVSISTLITNLPHKSPIELQKEGDLHQQTYRILEDLNKIRSILYRIRRDIRSVSVFEEKYLHNLGDYGKKIMNEKAIEKKAIQIDKELSVVTKEVEDYMRFWMDIRDSGNVPRSRVMGVFSRYYSELNFFSKTKVIDVLQRIIKKERQDANYILNIDRRIFFRRIH